MPGADLQLKFKGKFYYARKIFSIVRSPTNRQWHSPELASDLFQILSESFESEFESVRPESALEGIYLKRLSLYSSVATVFQTSMLAAMSELLAGRDGLYDAIRKAARP